MFGESYETGGDVLGDGGERVCGQSDVDDAHLMINSVLDGACDQPTFKRPLYRHEYGVYSQELMILRATCQSIAPLLPHNYRGNDETVQ